MFFRFKTASAAATVQLAQISIKAVEEETLCECDSLVDGDKQRNEMTSLKDENMTP